VFFPREVRVQGDSLQLGQVCVLHGPADLLAKAAPVALGRAPWAGEELVLSRDVLLSRLATAGVPGQSVRILGAPKVSITRDETTLDSRELIEAALALLEANHPAPRGASYRPVGGVEPVSMPPGAGRRIVARWAKDVPGGAEVEVAVAPAGGAPAVRTVRFRLAWPRKQAVAAKDIAAGALLGPDNVRIETVQADSPSSAEPPPVVGMAAAAAIPAGTVIQPSLVKAAPVVRVVRRNQTVVMRIRGEGFAITAVGQALQDGRPGDLIRVQNVDSKRVVTARVQEDGSVIPLREGETS
jgi:flagella basal body P-ring formation protein FlgA